MKKFMVPVLVALSFSAMAERFDGINNPANFNRIIGTTMVTALDDLPLSARLSDDRLAWSETYWPSNKGGIAYRWNSPDPQPFKYRFNTREDLMSMSQEAMSQLSPAELYDIAQGDYSYTLTKKTLSQFTLGDIWWEGICHGWSQAAATYPEPDAVTITNPDGIKVPFGSSDVKGLLAMHDAFNEGGAYARVGERCAASGKVPGESDERDANPNPPAEADAEADKCRDTNAGAFHVVITNVIGIHARSFVADIDRYNDVWNQPIYGYASQIVGEDPVTSEDQAVGVTRRVRVINKMTYGEELQFWTPERAATGMTNFVQKLPVTGTPNQAFRVKTYEYSLELDATGRIVGGTWVSATRPDFLWMKKRVAKFQSGRMPLSGLDRIYRPVRH